MKESTGIVLVEAPRSGGKEREQTFGSGLCYVTEDEDKLKWRSRKRIEDYAPSQSWYVLWVPGWRILPGICG